MTETLLRLYHLCFAGNVRAEETVRKLLELPGSRTITEEKDGAVVGAAVLYENTVLMLCVLPDCRGQGRGSRLVERCEALAREAGYEEIKFCEGPGYVTPGIPLTEENRAFFEKRGYRHAWGDCECVDMSLALAKFENGGRAVGDAIDGVTYRWAGPEDREQVLECARDGHPPFERYYAAESLYRGEGNERVLAAFCDGKVCGALLVGVGKERENVGSPGCTVTRQAYQRRGIATNLVRLGTGYLKELGLETGFIGYTYTDIVPLYARSGYEVCARYLMGKKKLG